MESLGYYTWLHRTRRMWYLEPPRVEEWQTRLYTGLPGSGKTLSLVRDVLDALRGDVRVASNIYIRDIRSGRATVQVSSWLDVLRLTVDALESETSLLVAIDEIPLMCDARAFAATPGWWLAWMANARHYGMGIVATAQHMRQVDVRLRLLMPYCLDMSPSGVRRLWSRVPLFHERALGMGLMGDEVEVIEGDHRWRWMTADVRHSYSTRELLPAQDWSTFKDQAVAAEVDLLTCRAQEIMGVPYIECFR